MEKIISICGNICNNCAAFKATRKDDDLKRRKTAKSWSKMYSSNISPEDINCEGCMTAGGKKFSYCGVCEIRKCGMKKNVKNCAYCDEYICDKLEEFFQMVPKNREMLNGIIKTDL